jgi:hypothetical protein
MKQSLTKFGKILLALALAAGLASCGSSGTTAVTAATTVVGSAGDGPVTGGTVTVRDANGNVVTTTPAAPTTGANAQFSFTVPPGTPLPLTITVTGGTDTVTGAAQDFPLQTAVTTLPAGGTVTGNANPLSTLAVASALAQGGGTLTTGNLATATTNVLGSMGFGLAAGANPLSTPVTNANVANMVRANEAAAEMIRRASNASGNSLANTITSIAQDLTDGVVDGRVAAGATNTQVNNANASHILNQQAQVSAESLANNLTVTDPNGNTLVTGANSAAALNASITTTNRTGDINNEAPTQAFLDQTRNAINIANTLTGGGSAALNNLMGGINALTAGTVPTNAQQTSLAGLTTAATFPTPANIAANAAAAAAAATTAAADTTAPAAPVITAPAAGVTGDNTPTVTGTAEANSLVTVLAGSTSVGTVTADGAGAWTLTSSVLADGAYALTATATDAAANTGAASAAVNITVDATAPTATLSTTATNPTNAAFTATLTFNEAATGVTLADFAVGNGAAGSFAAVSGTVYTALITPAGQGAVTVDVAANAASDAAGNGNTVATQLSVTFDNVAPTTTITSKAFSADTGASSTDFITKTTAQTISGTLSAVTVTGEIVQVSLDNGATWATASNNIGQNTWSLAGQTLSGNNTLQVRVTDTAGNNGTAATQAYVLDTTAPTTTVASKQFSADTGTSATDFITKTAAQTISGTLSAVTVAGEIVEVSLDNGTTWTTASNATGQNTWSLAGQTLSGNNTLQVRVTDTAGNSGTAVTQAYVLDTTAPTATLSTTSANPTNTSPIPVKVTFSEAVTGVALAGFTVNNGTAGNLVAVSTTVYTVDVTPTAAGAVTIDYAANTRTDSAGNGNTAATQLSVTYDNVAPTATLSTTSASPTATTPIPVSLTFSEAVTGVAASDFIVGNGTAGNLGSTSSTSYTIDITPTAAGAVTIDYAANTRTDSAGNGNTAATQLSVTFNHVPTASNVTITDNNGGTAVVGDQLTGGYTYADVDGDAEGASSFRWLRNGTAITNATSSTYTLVVADAGQFVTFEVTPVAATGVTTGSAVTSTSLAVDKANQTALSFNSASMTVLTDNAPFTNALSGGSGTGALSFLSSDTTVATVDNAGLVTIIGSGTTTISVTKAGDSNYNPANTSFTLQVWIKPTVTGSAINNATVGGATNLSTTLNVTIDPRGTASNSYQLVGVPPLSSLTDTYAASGSLTPDVEGKYIVKVVVSDGLHDSTPYYMDVLTTNSTSLFSLNNYPVANAGLDIYAASVGTQLTLDGSNSAVTQGSISYQWVMEYAPAGSTVSLGVNIMNNISFTPDVEGVYILRLTVSDGTNSSTDTVQVYTTGAMTNVSGAINTPTTWTLANSPYNLTGHLNITDVLNIDPGVVIIANNNWFKLDSNAAKMLVNGTATRPVYIKGAHINAKGGTTPEIVLRHMVLESGSMCLISGGTTGYRDCKGGLTVEDSILLGSFNPYQYQNYAYIWYPVREFSLRRTMFIDYEFAFARGTDRRSGTIEDHVENNVFYNFGHNSPYGYDGYESWANYQNTQRHFVRYNTLLNSDLRSTPGYSSASYDARYNYWQDKGISLIPATSTPSKLPVYTSEHSSTPDHRKYTPYDADGDGILDSADNCPSIANANQADANGDGVGDVCTDTTAPAAPTVGSPTDGATVTTNTPTVSGTAEAGAAITLYSGTTTLTEVGTTTVDANGNWTLTSGALLNGTHTLTVTATDSAGNVSIVSAGVTITVNGNAIITGAAVDGYVSGATLTVYSDLALTTQIGSGTTDPYGQFSIQLTVANVPDPIYIKSVGGTDIDTGMPAPTMMFTVSGSPTTGLNITPMTNAVYERVQDGQLLNTAQLGLIADLGVGDNAGLYGDPAATGNLQGTLQAGMFRALTSGTMGATLAAGNYQMFVITTGESNLVGGNSVVTGVTNISTLIDPAKGLFIGPITFNVATNGNVSGTFTSGVDTMSITGKVQGSSIVFNIINPNATPGQPPISITRVVGAIGLNGSVSGNFTDITGLDSNPPNPAMTKGIFVGSFIPASGLNVNGLTTFVNNFYTPGVSNAVTPDGTGLMNIVARDLFVSGTNLPRVQWGQSSMTAIDFAAVPPTVTMTDMPLRFDAGSVAASGGATTSMVFTAGQYVMAGTNNATPTNLVILEYALPNNNGKLFIATAVGSRRGIYMISPVVGTTAGNLDQIGESYMSKADSLMPGLTAGVTYDVTVASINAGMPGQTRANALGIGTQFAQPQSVGPMPIPSTGGFNASNGYFDGNTTGGQSPELIVFQGSTMAMKQDANDDFADNQFSGGATDDHIRVVEFFESGAMMGEEINGGTFTPPGGLLPTITMRNFPSTFVGFFHPTGTASPSFTGSLNFLARTIYSNDFSNFIHAVVTGAINITTAPTTTVAGAATLTAADPSGTAITGTLTIDATGSKYGVYHIHGALAGGGYVDIFWPIGSKKATYIVSTGVAGNVDEVGEAYITQ